MRDATDSVPPATAVALQRPGPGSIVWRIHRERVMLLSWGRAILMQFAHPLVAAGVAEHSSFSDDPRANRARLNRTVQAMLDLTFGTPAVAAAAAARINRIHDYVAGRLTETTGSLPAGTPYSAHMDDLLLWVHATLLDSALVCYQRFVGPLTLAEQDQYCAESRIVGVWLGVPVEHLPATRAALDAYLATTSASSQIAIGAVGRGLGHRLVTARPALLVRGPLLAVLHWPTVGLLPPPLRQAYGIDWTPWHEQALTLMAATVRTLLRVTPPLLRFWPIARQAQRRAGRPHRGSRLGGAPTTSGSPR